MNNDPFNQSQSTSPDLYANMSNQDIFTSQPKPLRGLKLSGVFPKKQVAIKSEAHKDRVLYISKEEYDKDPEAYTLAEPPKKRKKIKEDDSGTETELTQQAGETDEDFAARKKKAKEDKKNQR